MRVGWNTTCMKLFIWKDTETFSGSSFGGTLFTVAETADEARGKLKRDFGTAARIAGIERDLAKEPTVSETGSAHGGDD